MWPSLERTARFVRAAYVDARLLLTGKSERGIPPLRLRFVGSGDFRAVGEHLLWLAETRGHLKPDSRILDIGCGSGRFALPLTKLLAGGEYEGFDVVAAATRWCTRNITRQHPNFHFTHVSLRNSDYSVRGGAASRFVFPNRDSYFDCVVPSPCSPISSSPKCATTFRRAIVCSYQEGGSSRHSFSAQCAKQNGAADGARRATVSSCRRASAFRQAVKSVSPPRGKKKTLVRVSQVKFGFLEIGRVAGLVWQPPPAWFR